MLKRRWIPALLVVVAAIVAWLSLRAFIGNARIRGLSGEPGISVIVIDPFALDGPSHADARLRGLGFLLALDLEPVEGLRVMELDRGVGRRSVSPRFVVDGSAEVLDDTLELAVYVHDRLRGRVVAHGQARGLPRELSPMIDRLAAVVVQGTLRDRAPDRAPCLACITSRSSAALVSYLEGEARYRAGDLEGAANDLSTAVRLDPAFGLAWLRLADVAEWSDELREPWRAASARASRLSDRLPGRYAVRARARLALSQGRTDQLASLKAAARRWPDDPDLWALLGSTLFLVGPAAVAKAGEAEESLARATALRPSFAPAYVHRVDLALASADSPRATALLDTLEALAPDAGFTSDRRLRWALAFGDEASRREALLALRGRPATAIVAAREALCNPLQRATRRNVLEVAIAAPSTGRAEALAILAWSELLADDAGSAHLALDDPELDAATRLGILYSFWSRGADIAAAELDQAAVASLADSDRLADPVRASGQFFAAVWALERGREGEGRRALAGLRLAAKHASGPDDGGLRRFAVAAARGIEGFDARLRGEDEEAIRRLEGALRDTGGVEPELLVNAQIRWWLAELHAKRNQPYQALAYFDSFWWDPMAARRADEIRARLGDAEASTDRP